jgi:hypothetical protein
VYPRPFRGPRVPNQLIHVKSFHISCVPFFSSA